MAEALWRLAIEPAQQVVMDAWLAARPGCVQAAARRCPPNRLYAYRSVLVVVTGYTEHEGCAEVRAIVTRYGTLDTAHEEVLRGVPLASLRALTVTEVRARRRVRH